MKPPLNRHLALPPATSAIAAETFFLPLLGVAAGLWLNPNDPLWIHADFPWIWFAPVILALRYGPLSGLAGTSLLALAWFVLRITGAVPEGFPKTGFLAGLILVMLAGEFSSLWLTRARRAEAVSAYLDGRLDGLTRQYYLLRLSHDRLEQDLISRPVSMRDAIGVLRRLPNDARESGLPGAVGLLRLIAQYGQIDAAALYTAEGDGFAAFPAARIGQLRKGDRLAIDDPLLVYAIENGSLAHVGTSDPVNAAASRYVIVAPIVAFDGTRMGLLVVERLPFFALHEETLQTINVLLAYYADSLIRQRLATEILAVFPDCPADFAAELQRLRRIRDVSGIDSTLVVLVFPDGDLATATSRLSRAIDVTWLIAEAPRPLLLTLLPLSGGSAAEGYLARIDRWLHQTRDSSLDECGIVTHVLRLGDAPFVSLLHRITTLRHASDATVHPGPCV